MRDHSPPTVPNYPPKLPPLSRPRPLSYPEPHEAVSPLGPEPVKCTSPVSPLRPSNSLPFTSTTHPAQYQSQQNALDHPKHFYPTLKRAGAEDSYYPEEPFTIPHKEAATKHTMYWHPIRQPNQPASRPAQTPPAKATTNITRKPLPPQPKSIGYPSIQQPPEQARLHQQPTQTPKPSRPRHKQPPHEMPLPLEGGRKKVEWDAVNLLEAQRRDKLVRRGDARNCRRWSIGVLVLLFVGGVIFGVVYALVKRGGTS